jgi:hypothetical protein
LEHIFRIRFQFHKQSRDTAYLMPFVFKDSGSGILTLSVGLMGKTICRGGGGVSASLASPVGVSASLGSGIVSLEGGSGGGGVSALVGSERSS